MAGLALCASVKLGRVLAGARWSLCMPHEPPSSSLHTCGLALRTPAPPGKLVDGVAGDRLVFRRRGKPQSNPSAPTLQRKHRLHFVLDCSGSMCVGHHAILGFVSSARVVALAFMLAAYIPLLCFPRPGIASTARMAG
jgi:hypothetical protein